MLRGECDICGSNIGAAELTAQEVERETVAAGKRKREIEAAAEAAAATAAATTTTAAEEEAVAAATAAAVIWRSSDAQRGTSWHTTTRPKACRKRQRGCRTYRKIPHGISIL